MKKGISLSLSLIFNLDNQSVESNPNITPVRIYTLGVDCSFKYRFSRFIRYFSLYILKFHNMILRLCIAGYYEFFKIANECSGRFYT